MDQRAKERVEIAKDALEWVKAGALIARVGPFVRPINPVDWEDNPPANIQLRDMVIGPCKVCMLGALFLAKAVRFNNVCAEQLFGSYFCTKQGQGPIADHFDKDQLQLIEDAYEGFSYDALSPASIFYQQYPNHKNRMIAILSNIIENQGTFEL